MPLVAEVGTLETVKGEADLLAELRTGSDAALTELYERLSPHIYALLLRLLESRADADEVLQDTFVTLMDKAHLYDPGRGSVRAFVYTLARNLALSKLRVRRSHQDKVALKAWEEASVLPESFEDGMVRKILLHDALEQLSQADRDLLEHAFILGMSHSQLVEHFGLPLGTVKAKLRRSLAKLRTLLEEQ